MKLFAKHTFFIAENQDKSLSRVVQGSQRVFRGQDRIWRVDGKVQYLDFAFICICWASLSCVIKDSLFDDNYTSRYLSKEIQAKIIHDV